jgi:hypothetical protein
LLPSLSGAGARSLADAVPVALAYALRRTSARVVLVVGAIGLFWTVAVPRASLEIPGSGARPIVIPWGVYRVLGSGFSLGDSAVAALAAAVAVVAAAALWRGRAISR